MSLKFEEWLSNQQNRQDGIGDFARVLSKANVPTKTSRQKWDEHKGWADVVSRIPEPGHISAFNLAWREFVQAKAVEEVSLD